jgi:hypothetical protein
MKVKLHSSALIKKFKNLQAITEGILPFKEKPSSNPENKSDKSTNENKATDLFSLFTADIIKEEIIFIR